MQELRAQIQAQLKLADTLKKLGEQAEKNNLALDLDIGNDLSELKANLAKFKKGKHGKGLDDIDIEQLDWVWITIKILIYFFKIIFSGGKQQKS